MKKLRIIGLNNSSKDTKLKTDMASIPTWVCLQYKNEAFLISTNESLFISFQLLMAMGKETTWKSNLNTNMK